MNEINGSKYSKFTIKGKNGSSMIYTRLNKALYGIMKAAFLFYEKLSSDTIEYGFKLNPYYVCVSNKLVKGTQLISLWHMDDMKLSHQDQDVVTETINWLRSKYEEGGSTMKVARGKVHELLGMKIDFEST